MLSFIMIFCVSASLPQFTQKKKNTHTHTHAISVVIQADDAALSNQKMPDRWPCHNAEEQVRF